MPLDLIYLTTSVLNTGSKIIVNTVFCAQGKIVFWISLMINHPKSGWVFSTNTRDFHENLILLKSYYYLHFLKATYLRSNLQKKISKSVHWFTSYSTFCTRNWSSFACFQYKGLLGSNGTEKDSFRNNLKKTEIISSSF